jgi:hypothetical protein
MSYYSDTATETVYGDTGGVKTPFYMERQRLQPSMMIKNWLTKIQTIKFHSLISGQIKKNVVNIELGYG